MIKIHKIKMELMVVVVNTLVVMTCRGIGDIGDERACSVCFQNVGCLEVSLFIAGSGQQDMPVAHQCEQLHCHHLSVCIPCATSELS
jgi:hypothetical protein